MKIKCNEVRDLVCVAKNQWFRRSVRWWICLRLQSRVPEPPAHLQGLQRACWNEVARVLVAKNIYDKDREMMLAAFCVQYARFLTADEKVKEQGLIILNKKGAGMHNPYVGISNSAYDRAVRLASELVSHRSVASVW